MSTKAIAMTVIGFTGHQGLTPSTESLVSSAISVLLQQLGRLEGVCSLAEGSDQIFARAVLAEGGMLSVVIPCENYESTFTAANVLAEYQRLTTLSSSRTQLDFSEPSEEAFWAAGKFVADQADELIAVWDGKAAGGLGGTADVVAYAREQGKAVRIVWPTGAERG